MTITMNDTYLSSLNQIRLFLEGSATHSFTASRTSETYEWINKILIRFAYHQLDKKDKSLIRKYLSRVTGYSRSQLTRLITGYAKTGKVVKRPYKRNVFQVKYSGQDIQLLAKTDELHDTPNGKAIKHILEREWQLFHNRDYERLSQISVSQIYNLRASVLYKRINKNYQKTKATTTAIGERVRPKPNGKPGYLRVDTVHQGDRDKQKGVYHINIVDEITHFEFMGAVEYISESHLTPMLEQLIAAFPFVILEIHADNGSEYINQYVARILYKLMIRLTKNRSRKSNDNALVESKNGAVIRKWIGYDFLPKGFAKHLNVFYFGIFHEYINYHRPCAFPKVVTDKKGKQVKSYPQENYLTPYDKFKSLPNCQQFLKPHVTLEQLEAISLRKSDTQLARVVQLERSRLFSKQL